MPTKPTTYDVIDHLRAAGEPETLVIDNGQGGSTSFRLVPFTQEAADACGGGFLRVTLPDGRVMLATHVEQVREPGPFALFYRREVF